MAGVTSVVIDGTTYLVDDINAVDFSEDQGLSEQQQEQGRSNIGAAAETELDGKADETDLNALAGTVGELSDDVEGLTAAMADKASAIVDTASGAIASFPDGAAVAAKDITIGIEPVQSGSGDPSPTNVRPISGWTGANVTRTGFNVWDEEWEVGVLNNDGSVDSSSNRRTTSFIPVIPNTTYFQQSPTAAYTGRYAFYNADKQIVKYDLNGVPSVIKKITAPENAHYLRITFGVNYGTTYNHDICINISDPAKNGTYEPGHVVTYPITFPSEAGTVYGGTLDVTTGLLTVDKIGINILITSIYNRPGNDSVSFGVFSLPYAWSVPVDIICEKGFYVETYDTTIYGRIVIFDTPARKMAICCPRNYTVEECQAFFGDCMFVYELATPQTYQLTPVEIEMLLGDNNVWADTGDSTVAYRADTKLYIQKINAPTDDDMIADAQIASGKYFIVGGNLYRSTTTIPAGDAINPGSNCILTNLADALNALNT